MWNSHENKRQLARDHTVTAFERNVSDDNKNAHPRGRDGVFEN